MKILPIKKSADFKKISKDGKKFHAKTVLLLTLPSSEIYLQDPAKNQNAKDFCRIGYTVSKTVGNAVTRNCAKRRLREAVRNLCKSYAKNHYDYVLIAKREIAVSNLEAIKSDLKFCLKRIHQTVIKS